MLDKEKMISILEDKLSEGYDIVSSKSIADKDYGTVVMNMFETDKTIEQLKQEIAFDKEMTEKVEIKMSEEVEKALSKNEEVVL